ncbi:MAG: hypothetical protein ABIQ27_05430 [Flavobacterium sp.]
MLDFDLAELYEIQTKFSIKLLNVIIKDSL